MNTSKHGRLSSANKQANWVFLSLGSNMGNAELTISSAIKELALHFSISGISNLYRTKPQEVKNQPEFVNAALRIELARIESINPESILQRVQSIEKQFGRDRKREQRYGPRNLDIDIILWGQLIINTSHLDIPHPSYLKRRFVLQPILDIDADLIDPQSQIPLSKYLDGLLDDPEQEVRRINWEPFKTSGTSD